jgi:hypothetical protein
VLSLSRILSKLVVLPRSRAHIHSPFSPSSSHPASAGPFIALPQRTSCSSSVDSRQKRLHHPTAVSPSSHAHFSTACPTCAPGDAIRIHSVLNTFFHAPVSGEKEMHLKEPIAGAFLFCILFVDNPHTTAERAGNKNPKLFLLIVEQMAENGHHVSFLSRRRDWQAGRVHTGASGGNRRILRDSISLRD